jgi:hypothetical protein
MIEMDGGRKVLSTLCTELKTVLDRSQNSWESS